MKELDLEGQLLVPPERVIGTEADVAPLVVGDLEEPVGHLALLLAKGLRGELLRLLADRGEVERLLGAGGRRPGRGRDGEEPAGRPETSSQAPPVRGRQAGARRTGGRDR